MTYLVTGGAGFIGSNFILYLRKKYPAARILCLDKFTYAADPANLKEMEGDGNFRLIRGDICDEALVERVFAEEAPQVIVNFAAESHVDRSIADAEPFIRSNIEGVRVLLEACRRHGGRFHQISTDEVYGDLAPDAPPAKEQSPLCPSSPYSASKASADLLVLAYRRTYGLAVTISRCSNNYGPRQHREKFIPTLLHRLAADQPLPLYGDGRAVRDWLYVWDHCAAIDAILTQGKEGEIYNIGGNWAQENRAVARCLAELLGKEATFEFLPDRLGHDLRYAVDCKKINALGWRPQTAPQEGMRQTIFWYQQKGEKR